MTISRTRFAAIWILFGIFSRLMPHYPNITPLTNLCLFAGSQLSRLQAFIITLSSLIISDLLLAYFNGYPAFGSWTLFTYSGFAAMIFIGKRLSQKHWPAIVCYVFCSSLGFWLWTNFGVWLLSPLYPQTMTGFMACYTTALPFLRNSLLGDLAWMLIIFGGFKYLSLSCQRKLASSS